MPWREQLNPDTLLRARAGGLRRDGAGRHHGRGGVPLRPPPPGRPTATATRTRWVSRCVRRPTRPASGSRCSTPATSRAGLTAAATCRSTTGSDGSATARSRRGRTRVADRPTSDTVRLGAAIHSVRAVPPRRPARRRSRQRRATAARCTCTCPSSPARTSPARCSTARRPPSCSTRPGPWGRARRPCTPPTCPTTTSSCSAARAPARASAPRPSATSPTASARPARCTTPEPALAGLRPARRHRPVRGGARRSRCTSGSSPTSATGSRPTTCSWRPFNGYRSLGWSDGGLMQGRLADFVTVRTDSPTRPGARPTRSSTRRRPRT